MSPGLPYWYLRPRRKKQHMSPGHTLLSLSRSRPSHAHSFAATVSQPQSQKEVFALAAGSFPSTFSLLAPPATKQPKHFWSFFLTKPLPEISTAPCCRFPTVFKGLLIPACTKNAERSLPHSSSPFPSVSQAAPVGPPPAQLTASTLEKACHCCSAVGKGLARSVDLLHRAANARHFLEATGVPLAGCWCGLTRVNRSLSGPLLLCAFLSKTCSLASQGWD